MFRLQTKKLALVKHAVWEGNTDRRAAMGAHAQEAISSVTSAAAPAWEGAGAALLGPRHPAGVSGAQPEDDFNAQLPPG